MGPSSFPGHPPNTSQCPLRLSARPLPPWAPAVLAAPTAFMHLPASWVVSGTMAVEVKEALTFPVE